MTKTTDIHHSKRHPRFSIDQNSVKINLNNQQAFIPLSGRLLPESIRWLLTNGKKEEARKTFEHLAQWNKKTLSNEMTQSIDNLCSNEPSMVSVEKGSEQGESDKPPFMEVMRSKTILLRFFNCCYCWFISALVFYGLSIYAVNIAGSKYLNFIIVSTVELPGCVIVYFLLNRGRKLALCFGLAVSGTACLAFHFLPPASTMSLIVYFLGKMSITLSSTTMCVLASEMFPTQFRNTLFGFASTISVLGNVVAPQVPLLAKYVDPLLVFSGLALTAFILGLFFPETLNCTMPDSLKDAENIGKTGEKNAKQ